jgi:hypothetical protein
MLDCQDGRALCLAKDGEKQPVRILETPEKFTIEWKENYHIEGDEFIVTEKSGQIKVISGSPTSVQ